MCSVTPSARSSGTDSSGDMMALVSPSKINTCAAAVQLRVQQIMAAWRCYQLTNKASSLPSPNKTEARVSGRLVKYAAP